MKRDLSDSAIRSQETSRVGSDTAAYGATTTIRRKLLVVPTLVGLGVLSSAVGGPWLVAVPDPQAQIILELGLAAACLVPIMGAVRRGPLNPLELGVSVAIFYLLLFPIRAVVVLNGLDGFANQRVIHAPGDSIRFSMAVAIWGLMAGGLAYNASLGVRLARRVRLPAFPSLESPNLWLSVALFLVGLASQVVIVGINNAFGKTDLGPGIESTVSQLTVLMIIGLSLVTIKAAQAGQNFARLILGLTVLVGLGAGLIGQFKEPAIITVLTVFITWQFRARKNVSWRAVLLPVLVVILLIFPLVTLARNTSERLRTQDPVTVLEALPATADNYALAILTPLPPGAYRVLTDPLLLVSNRLYGFDSFVLAVRFTPSVIPFQDGRTLTGILVGAVPRALSPDKPNIGIGVWFAYHYWGGAPGVPVVPQAVGHPAELWINFGVAGVVIGLALLGIWYRFLYVALNPSRSAVHAVLYSVVFVTVVDVDRDIQLTYVTLIQRVVTTALLLGILFLLSASRLRRQAESGLSVRTL